MRAVLLLVLAQALVPWASADSGEVIASGSILVGGPHTELVGSVSELGGPDGIDGFAFDPTDVQGLVITTVTTSSGGAYDLDLWFRNAAGDYVPSANPGVCATPAPDEVCTVPGDAVDGFVVAFSGRQLTVQVVEV